MKCSNCHEREAVTELTKVANDQVTKIPLCERCASELGLDTTLAIGKTPLATYIAAMGQGFKDNGPPTEPGAFICGSCGATLQDFRESGRLGCPDCYRTLGSPLRELLRRLHGATRHAGERYAPPGASAGPSEPDRRGPLEIREQLRRAIEAENFELAAQLRDQLKDLV
ncbi:MAG: UvrB/UvrC motif-containing protein [Gemmatimonadota bacterium]